MPDFAHSLHNASLYNASLSTGDTFMFAVPGTPISLMLSKFHGLLSQGELDLCIIEGLGSIFESVVAKGTDGGLPLHTWSSEWANNIINIDDFHPPDFVMTYGYLVTVLRGIALFTSQHGYVEMDFHVYLDNEGYIGAGNLGQIIPSKTS